MHPNRPVDQIATEFLVLQTQDGNAEALNALLEKWQQRLWLLAMRMTGEPDAAHDVLQESLIAISKGIQKLREPATFRSWAFQIVANKSRDWIRKQRRRSKAHADAGMKFPETAQTNPAPAGLADLVRHSLAQLPSDQQAILTLFYIDDLSTAEISNVLDVPTGTVKSRLHNARQHLKTVITREDQL